jgi:hypothetical protein
MDKKLIIESIANEYAMRDKNPYMPFTQGTPGNDAAECLTTGRSHSLLSPSYDPGAEPKLRNLSSTMNRIDEGSDTLQPRPRRGQASFF